MTKRLLSGLAIATLAVGGRLVSTAPTVTAAQDRPSRPVSAPDTRVLSQDASGMVALQRHAQVNMLLDGRRPDPPTFVSVRLPVDAVALTLPSAAK